MCCYWEKIDSYKAEQIILVLFTFVNTWFVVSLILTRIFFTN